METHTTAGAGQRGIPGWLASLPAILTLALTGLLILGTGLTYAVFTAQAPVGQNTTGTATVSLSTAPASQLFSLSDILPGFKNAFALDVTNDGSAELRYALATTVVSDSDSTNPLSGQLAVDIHAGSTTDSCSTIISNTTAAFSGSLGSAGFGSSAQGSDAGDRVLAAGAAERLCLNLSLDISTGNAYQGDSTEVEFVLDAEQTANNA